MKKLFVIAVISAIASVSLAQVANGDFETGDFTGWSTQPAASGSLFGVDTVFPHLGIYSAYFGAYNGSPDTIYQSVSVTNGQEYTLSFWLFNEDNSGGDNLAVSWEGSVLFNASAPTSWTRYAYNVTAHSNSAEIRIVGRDAPDFTHVDDVSLSAVPEPASMAMLGAGVLAVVRRRPRAK